MIYSKILRSACLGMCAMLLFGACNNSDPAKTNGPDTRNDTITRTDGSMKPKGGKPAWGPSITNEMLTVIEKLESYNAPPIESLTAQEARKNPTPTTAVMDLIKENNITVPAPMCDTMGKEIPVKGGSVHARIYTPKTGDKFPVIVYYHGGGWVIADLNTYNASAQALCEQTNSVVVSVEYRKGPEYKFPTAHNDSYAAYEWVWKHLGDIKGDTIVAVAGESAGANLAANVSIMARDKKMHLPVYQLLVYPVASDDMNAESYQKFAMAKPLNKPMMAWFGQQYLPAASVMSDPRIALVKANLAGLPPTTIIGAEIDPLQSDGKMLSDKLMAAGVAVNYKLYQGVTHEFFGMALLIPEAKEAQALAASDLKKALHK